MDYSFKAQIKLTLFGICNYDKMEELRPVSVVLRGGKLCLWQENDGLWYWEQNAGADLYRLHTFRFTPIA